MRGYVPKIGLLLTLAIVIMAIGCSHSPPVAKIGLVGPFTGRHRDIGYDVIYSARLAVREINESGGIGPYRLALVALDDFGDPELARANALTLTRDPAVVAVIGHWLPETTQSATPIYNWAKVPFIDTGEQPFGYQDPAILPLAFSHNYAELTPFDEVAGPYAASGYDAVQLVKSAMEQIEDERGSITRTSLTVALRNASADGLTGRIYQR
jgi:ABC-type branched-subunit amino acid transport system substrate-binding protein